MSVRRLDATGEPVFGRPNSLIPTGTAATAQLVYLNLKLMKEEWFLDRTAGTGWVDLGAGEPRVFGGSADQAFLEAEVKRVVLSTEGVSTILAFDFTFDHDTRRASVDALVSDIYGEEFPLKLVLP